MFSPAVLGDLRYILRERASLDMEKVTDSCSVFRRSRVLIILLKVWYPPSSTRRPRSPPMVILGYKERGPDGRSSCGMLASEVGIHLEKVGGCEGW